MAPISPMQTSITGKDRGRFTSELTRCSLNHIEVPADRRPTDPKIVEALYVDIDHRGLLQPIGMVTYHLG